MIATAALTLAYAYLIYARWWKRVVFVAAALLVSMVANGLRAYGLVLIAHLSDMRLATGADHLIYGWQFYGLVMLVIFWAGFRWRDEQTLRLPIAQKARLYPGGARGKTLARLALVLPIVSAAPLFGRAMAAQAEQSGADDVVLEAPMARFPWRGAFAASGQWRPSFADAASDVLARYSGPRGEVEVFAAYYSGAPSGGELITSANNLYDPAQWKREGRSTRSVGNGGRIVFGELAVRAGGQKRLVWYVYRIGSAYAASRVHAKALEAWNRLRLGDASSVVMAFSAPYRDDPRPTRRLLEDYVTKMLNSWDRAIPRSAGAIGRSGVEEQGDGHGVSGR